MRFHPKCKPRIPLCSTPSLKTEFIYSLLGRHAPSKLGDGGYGKVYRMYEKHSGKPYAVKEVQKMCYENEDDYADRVYKEFEVASRLHHPNVVETFRLRARRCRWCVVMEYCANGDVHDLLAEEHKFMVTVEEKLCIFKQLLHAVEYLHGQGICHRDIKIENMLLNDVGHLKIADFGLSTTGDRSSGVDALSRCQGSCGTPVTMPPEVIAMGDGKFMFLYSSTKSPRHAADFLPDNEVYDGRAFDAWSCAATMLIMLSPIVPTWDEAKTTDGHYAHFLKQWAPYMPEGYTTLPDWVDDSKTRKFGPKFAAIREQGLRRLLIKMLHPDPDRRLTVSEALDDPFVQRIECCCVAPNSRDQASPARHYHGPRPSRIKLSLRGKMMEVVN